MSGVYRRVLKANDQTVEHDFFADDEEGTPGTVSGVTLDVTREDGTSLESGASVTSVDADTFSFDLTAATHTDRVDVLTLDWNATVDDQTVKETDYVEVVGHPFFTPLNRLRGMDGLGDASVFTNDHLRDAREIAAQFIEDFTEYGWVPRYRREVHDGDGGTRLWVSRLPARSLIAVKIDGTSQTLTDWTLAESGLLRTDGDTFDVETPEGQNVEVLYEYGEDRPPTDLERAALRLARHLLLTQETAIPDRANLMTTEFATFRLNTADEDHPTGLPEVDAVLRKYRGYSPHW